MTEMQAKYEELGRTLVKIPQHQRNKVIKEWCIANNLSYKNSKGQLIKPGQPDPDDLCLHQFPKDVGIAKDGVSRLLFCPECKKWAEKRLSGEVIWD